MHQAISPESFSLRVDEWEGRVRGVRFESADFEEMMEQTQSGDVIYCDPPYQDTQAILYGAQGFSLDRLFKAIGRAKKRGVAVLLSLDGSKKTGHKRLNFEFPQDLFEREVMINCGRSMLRRFQLEGQSLEHEIVQDRLLLTY